MPLSNVLLITNRVTTNNIKVMLLKFALKACPKYQDVTRVGTFVLHSKKTTLSFLEMTKCVFSDVVTIRFIAQVLCLPLPKQDNYLTPKSGQIHVSKRLHSTTTSCKSQPLCFYRSSR